MPNITSANSKLTLTVRNGVGVVVGPFTVQGYSENAMFLTESVEVADVRMGCDGKAAGGFMPALVPMTISLMANSPSLGLFETWLNTQKVLSDVLVADGVLLASSLQRAWALTKGFLRRVTPIPEGQKTFSTPVTYELVWEDVTPTPLPG